MSNDISLVPGPDGNRRLDFLDSLRGLAAVYVLVYHMLLLPQPNLVPPMWAAKFALAGGMGVTLFFVVSAFSLYYTMPLRLKDAKPTLSFYLHRYFRIAPLFYFWIVASIARDVWKFGASHSLSEVGSALTFSFNLFPLMQESFVWAGWTIGVEMLFYAAFPFIYRRITNAGSAVAFVFIALLIWLAIQLGLEYSVMPETWKQSILKWSVLRHLPIFAIGILLFHLFSLATRAGFISNRYEGIGKALLWGGIFTLVALLQGWLPNLFGDGYYWQGVVFGLIFMGLALHPWRPLVNRVTSYFGKISYSIYLSHTTVIVVLSPLYSQLYERISSLSVAFLASILMTLLIVVPVSALTYKLIEEPGITLGKKVAGWLKARNGTSARPENASPTTGKAL